MRTTLLEAKDEPVILFWHLAVPKRLGGTGLTSGAPSRLAPPLQP